MPRYDLYRSVHKFLRKRMYRFGEELGKIDFQKTAAVIDIKNSFDDIVFDLKMHAQKEEKYFSPL